RRLALAALLAGCASGDCPPGWKPLFDQTQLTRPVLAGWTNGADTWLVGGPVGAVALDTVVLRGSGGGWKTLTTRRRRTLWWVWGPSDGSEVWMVGEAGLVLRWRGSGFEVLDAGVSDATLFGVWGTGPDDVWVVGGNSGGGTRLSNDVGRHFGGRAWSGAAAARRRVLQGLGRGRRGLLGRRRGRHALAPRRDGLGRPLGGGRHARRADDGPRMRR